MTSLSSDGYVVSTNSQYPDPYHEIRRAFDGSFTGQGNSTSPVYASVSAAPSGSIVQISLPTLAKATQVREVLS